jgi:hypothetical protein
MTDREIFSVIASASEAIQLSAKQVWIASSLSLLAMTNSSRLVSRRENQPVGWVERSDTHHAPSNGDGFREGLNPSYTRLLICRHGKSNPGIGLRQINPTGKSLLIFRNSVKPRN